MQMDQLDFTQAITLDRPSALKGRRKKFWKASLAIQGKAFAQKELRFFASMLARLLQGGVPLLRALEVIENQIHGEKSKKVVHEIIREIQEGKSLSHALESFPGIFPKYFSQTVQAGELTGSVGTVLHSLADHLGKEEEMRKKVFEALTYPCFVLAVGCVTVLVLIRFVIPKITAVYEDFNAELPFLTRLILGANDRIFLAAGVLIAGVMLFALLARRQKEWAGNLALKLPGAGNFFQKSFLAQFSSLLSLQLTNGVKVLTALDNVSNATSFASFKGSIMKLKTALSEGSRFADALEGTSWLDEMSRALIRSGEESGKLAEVLGEIYKDTILSLESKSRFYLKVLEPLLILGVGCVVGVIVLSALLPILEMNSMVR